jgi:mono/diheme cytochrome c family protein
MRSLVLLVFFACLALVVGCQTSSFAPPKVDDGLIRAGAASHADAKTLNLGRDLFTSRCIECHTLPAISRYGASAWPRLVDKMAKRADLKPPERDALVAYLVTVRDSE